MATLHGQVVFTWTGGSAANSSVSTGANWSGKTAPTSSTSTYLTFSGTTRLTPALTSSLTVGNVTFGSSAGAFTIGGSSGQSLTIDAGGIVNNSSSTETINAAISLNADQTWSAAKGALVVGGSISSEYRNLTIDGSASTTLSGVISGGSSSNTLTKTGAGTLTLSGANSFEQVLVVRNGAVALASSSALGGSTWGNVIAAGGSVHLRNNITVDEGSFSLAGAGSGTGAIVNDSGANTLNAALSLSAAAKIGSTTGTLTLGGGIDTGSSTLTVSGAGDLVFGGQIYGAGGLTINDSGARTFQAAVNNSGALSVAGSGTTTFQSAVGGASSLTLSGSGTTTFSSSISTSGGVTLGGTGQTTVRGDINTNDANLVVSNTNSAASVNLAGNINAGAGTVSVTGAAAVNFTGSAVNAGGMSIGGSGAVTGTGSLNLGNGTLAITNTAGTSLSGAQINVDTISLRSSGDVSLASQISAKQLIQSGAGTTRLGGAGNNYITDISVTGGTLQLEKSTGFAVSNALSLANSTLSFAGDAQTSSYAAITLGSSSVVELNGTTQSLDSLTLTGSSIIDFGGTSYLEINMLSLRADAILTILNWSADDTFIVSSDVSAATLANIRFEGFGDAGWNSCTGAITPSRPVPEAPAYGFALLAMLLGLRSWRRDKGRGGASSED